MTAEVRVAEMLDECRVLIDERGKTHGPIDKTFTAIAALWSIRAGVEIKPADVCDMLADMKYVRSKASPDHRDNGVDAVNYTAFAYALRQ